MVALTWIARKNTLHPPARGVTYRTGLIPETFVRHPGIHGMASKPPGQTANARFDERMSTIEIACPQCGRKLKLPDRSMLGRKGRCSKCRHGFIMQAPAEKAVQFAEAPAPDHGNRHLEFAAADENLDVDSDKTLMGIAVRFVPEEPMGPGPAFVPSPAQVAALPPTPLAISEISSLSEVLADSTGEDDAENLSRVRKLRQQTKRKRLIMGTVAAVVALAAGLGLYASLSKPPNKIAKKGAVSSAQAKAADDAETATDDSTGSGAAAEKPGEQIALNFVPEGARIVIHLRPADLWQADESAEEFRACLGPLGVWLEGVIKERCQLEPKNIEEALFALIPISRDTFDVAVVVRSKADLKRSELISKFDGELVDQPKPHYVGKERAWIIGGNRTFASAPAAMAQSLAESTETPSATSDGVQALLSMTDRKQHFTLVCDLEDVRLGTKTLAPENAQKFLEAIVDFFGDDVDAVCWTLQLGDAAGANNMKSQVLVRNRLTRAPAKLQGDLKKKLARLPDDVLELVKMTHPKKIGEKKLIGRYPIMTKIVEQLTRFETGHRLVAMKVELPERAGPNLALGTLLTWHQTTLPGFGSAPAAPVVVATKPALPDKVADRLKKKITVDFRREFMYKAMEFVSDETGVTIKLDGPGMKDVGVTQNEKQDFAMEDVPATTVLQKILVESTKNKEFPNGKLVLVVDESTKTATITGVNFAKQKKQTPFPLEPAAK